MFIGLLSSKLYAETVDMLDSTFFPIGLLNIFVLNFFTNFKNILHKRVKQSWTLFSFKSFRQLKIYHLRHSYPQIDIITAISEKNWYDAV